MEKLSCYIGVIVRWFHVLLNNLQTVEITVILKHLHLFIMSLQYISFHNNRAIRLSFSLWFFGCLGIVVAQTSVGPIDCSDKENGFTFWGCKAFHRCNRGQPEYVECGPEEVFDEDIGDCNRWKQKLNRLETLPHTHTHGAMKWNKLLLHNSRNQACSSLKTNKHSCNNPAWYFMFNQKHICTDLVHLLFFF